MSKAVEKKEEVKKEELLFGAIPKKYLVDRYNKLVNENKSLLEEIAMLAQAIKTDVKMNVQDEIERPSE